MEEIKSNTPLNLEEFLRGILNSESVNLFLLYHLKELSVLPDIFEISINDTQRSRISPIKKTQGFIIFPNENNNRIVEDIVNVASKIY